MLVMLGDALDHRTGGLIAGVFFLLSASAASRGSFRMVGDTAVFHVVALVAALSDGFLVCPFNLRARYFVLALWLCLQILSGERVAPQLTCRCGHRQTPCSKRCSKIKKKNS